MRFIKETSAKQLKKTMKLYGIKVLRCIQAGKGVIITVDSDINNQKKAVQFFLEFDVFGPAKSRPSVVKTSSHYVDYGNLFWMPEVMSN